MIQKEVKRTHFLFATDLTKAWIDFILSAFNRGRGACSMATYHRLKTSGSKIEKKKNWGNKKLRVR